MICGSKNWSAKRQSPACWRGPPSLDQMNIIVVCCFRMLCIYSEACQLKIGDGTYFHHFYGKNDNFGLIFGR